MRKLAVFDSVRDGYEINVCIYQNSSHKTCMPFIVYKLFLTDKVLKERWEVSLLMTPLYGTFSFLTVPTKGKLILQDLRNILVLGPFTCIFLSHSGNYFQLFHLSDSLDITSV